MKKILCIFICVLLLGGCGGKKTEDVEKKPFEPSGFSGTVTTQINGLSVSAQVEYIPYDTLDFTFIAPQAVNGMTVSCRTGEYTLTAEGLTFTVEGDKLPFAFVCRTLEACFNRMRGAVPETDGEGCTVYSCRDKGRTYKLYADIRTGELQRLTVNGTDTLYFDNFTFSGQTE